MIIENKWRAKLFSGIVEEEFNNGLFFEDRFDDRNIAARFDLGLYDRDQGIEVPGARRNVPHVNRNLVTPNVRNIWNPHFQFFPGLRKVVNEISQADVVKKGAHVKDIPLIGEFEMGHLRAKDLPVIFDPLEKEDGLSSSGASHYQEQGIPRGTEHRAGMEAINLMTALQCDQEVLEEEPHVSKQGTPVV